MKGLWFQPRASEISFISFMESLTPFPAAAIATAASVRSPDPRSVDPNSLKTPAHHSNLNPKPSSPLWPCSPDRSHKQKAGGDPGHVGTRCPEAPGGLGSTCRFGDFPKKGVPVGGPHNKDYSILGSILGSPYFRKLPFMLGGSGGLKKYRV